jgi:ubiquinone/menaquinone biosynthesis C-methylase UbiE
VSTGNTLLDQCRKPSGWKGRFTLWRMNLSHSRLTDWGLSQIPIAKNATILDIGCGGGRTVSKLAAAACEGKVHGVDYSQASVAASTRANATEIRRGRVEIRQASVSQLPFDDNIFDLATAVETHFFWPNLPGDMREILRVLKPGGTLMIIAEVYKGSNTRSGKLAEKYLPLAGMILLTSGEHRDLFSSTGYSEIQVIEERSKGWICAFGKK